MENQESGSRDTKDEQNYDRAILLIQNQVQLLWLVFGAFLLTETVLLGGIASIAKEGARAWVFSGAIFGFLLCIPWWGSFYYNHAFYLLRIKEAKEFEPSQGEFLKNGQDLIDKKNPLEVSMSIYAIQPKVAISILIVMFALAFILIAGVSLCNC